jgi:hypothetical protein
MSKEDRSTLRAFAPPEEYQRVVRGGKPVVPCLLELLDEGEPVYRLAAFFGLGEITNERFGSAEDFAGETGDARKMRERVVSEWKAWWLANRNRSRAEWLIEDLSSEDGQKRNYAAEQLGKSGDKSAAPHLRKILKEDALNYRAARALAELGDEAAVPYLIELYLRHDMAEYRKQGIDLLQKLTGQTFDFDPNGSEVSRSESIKKWEEWWEKSDRRIISNK